MRSIVIKPSSKVRGDVVIGPMLWLKNGTPRLRISNLVLNNYKDWLNGSARTRTDSQKWLFRLIVTKACGDAPKLL